MLYLAIPAHNEVATIGVLLWRLRTVLAEFPREYEVVVYDDASTDDTAMVAEQYERAMPVTVLRGTSHLGYAGAVSTLLRHVAGLTRYPRRDAVLLLQGDFTDPPGLVPEFARRFEGGADLVVGERLVVADAPVAVRRLFKGAHWAMRPFVRVEGVRDMTASMRLVRISALREALRTSGADAFVHGDTLTANADLLLRLVPHARRVESVPLEPTYGVRMRDTRRVAMRDALGALKWAWGARGRRAIAGSAPDAAAEPERRGPRQGGKRRDESEPLSVDRIREKVRERDGSSGLDGDPSDARRDRERKRSREREAREPKEREAKEREAQERPTTAAEPRERPARPERPPRPERGRERERDGTRSGEPRPPRGEGRTAEPRAPRSQPRREEPRSPYADPTIELDDPFAAPAAKRDLVTRAVDSDVVERLPAESSLPAFVDSAPADDATGPDAAPKRVEPAAALPVRETARDDSDADGDAPVDAEGTTEASSESESETDDGSPRAPKRRRNRRSRRGRRKRDGSPVEGEADGGDHGDNADSDDTDDSGEPAPNSAPKRAPTARLRDPFGEHVEGEPVAFEPSDPDGEAGEGDDDDEASGAGAADGTGRQRRRGRRGRRGGARRSRGRRDREGGGGSGGDAGGEPGGDVDPVD